MALSEANGLKYNKCSESVLCDTFGSDFDFDHS